MFGCFIGREVGMCAIMTYSDICLFVFCLWQCNTQWFVHIYKVSCTAIDRRLWKVCVYSKEDVGHSG